MKERIILILVLTLAFVAGRTSVVSSQEATPSPEERELAARQIAAAQEIQKRAEDLNKSRQVWLDKSAKQSESNLSRATGALISAKARENETRFEAMQTSAGELLAISQKIYGELQAGGAQSIPIFLFKDLDDIEKTVKTLRKTAK